MDFNSDGVFPHEEVNAAYAGSTVNQVRYRGRGDEVNGGMWKLNDVAPLNDGYVYYAGNVPEFAHSDTTTPMSINVKLRLLNDVAGDAELLFNVRGAAGFLWLYFEYDSQTGASKLGGRHANGSIFKRNFPAGKTLGDFHVLSVVWDPTVVASFPAELYVDGESIGGTYAGIKAGWSNTDGNVEFGDEASIDFKNVLAEVDWLRFGTDMVVVPEPATVLVLCLGGLVALKRKR